MRTPKLLVIGLDCASPRFIFGPNAFDLPHLRGLMRDSAWGVLESCDPPITVPAWSCMVTGADPGELGCYGFRNRPDHSYAEMRVATSLAVDKPRVWDLLGDAGHSVVALGVPQTYPPLPVNGCLVSCLLTPDTSVDYTHPRSLADELDRECGGYHIDVPNFRKDAPEETVAELHALLDNRFRIAEHLIRTKPWEFFMLVEIGLDRLHHALWRYVDPAHPAHIAGHPLGIAFRRYYESLDRHIGKLLTLLPDDTSVLVVSDHGAKPIFGAIRVNQWLIDRGYLVLNSPAPHPHMLAWSEIDWSRTQAFSSGGYYARIFLNVEGREPKGVVPAAEYEQMRGKIARELCEIPLPTGVNLRSDVLYPEQLYPVSNGVPPDLLVYFGNLHYRAVGTVGVDSIHADGNDTGPDDANHAKEGLFMLRAPGVRTGSRAAASIYDIAPTILGLFGLPPKPWMHGRSLLHD